MTELVALRIIELAMAGERDADRLTARVLAEFGIENADDGSARQLRPDRRRDGSTPE